jgi:2'-5' RNA ligase
VRLFVAVWPPPEVVDLLRALPRPSVPGLRWTTEEQWHVTLQFLGEAEPAEATAALARLRWDGVPPWAVLGPRVRWFGGSVVHVPVAGLDDLATAVAAAVGAVGRAPAPARSFAGHLTLGRVNRGRVRFARVLGSLLDMEVAGRWTADEVTLVAGRLHPKGARYEVVARVALPTD